jgi:hypothetical protein
MSADLGTGTAGVPPAGRRPPGSNLSAAPAYRACVGHPLRFWKTPHRGEDAAPTAISIGDCERYEGRLPGILAHSPGLGNEKDLGTGTAGVPPARRLPATQGPAVGLKPDLLSLSGRIARAQPQVRGLAPWRDGVCTPSRTFGWQCVGWGLASSSENDQLIFERP